MLPFPVCGSNLTLYSCTPRVRSRARTTSSEDGVYVRCAMRSRSSRKLQRNESESSAFTALKHETRQRNETEIRHCDTHNPAVSSNRIFLRFKTLFTTSSAHKAFISSAQLAMTSVASSTSLPACHDPSTPSLDPFVSFLRRAFSSAPE